MSLTLSSLTFGYERQLLLHQVQATLPPQQLTALIGRNGTGKSTLLRLIATLEQPHSGSILWHNAPLHRLSLASRARLMSLVLTQRLDAIGLTVYETVAMGRIPYTSFWGNLRATDRAVIAKSMEQTHISHLATRLLASLSDGERQRTMIAKALAQETPLILLDEPTSFLDFRAKVDLLDLLHQLTQEEGKTILFSTHDIELALRKSNHLWLLHEQQLTSGTPTALLNNGVLPAFFAHDGLSLDASTLRLDRLH